MTRTLSAVAASLLLLLLVGCEPPTGGTSDAVFGQIPLPLGGTAVLLESPDPGPFRFGAGQEEVYQTDTPDGVRILVRDPDGLPHPLPVRSDSGPTHLDVVQVVRPDSALSRPGFRVQLR